MRLELKLREQIWIIRITFCIINLVIPEEVGSYHGGEKTDGGEKQTQISTVTSNPKGIPDPQPQKARIKPLILNPPSSK